MRKNLNIDMYRKKLRQKVFFKHLKYIFIACVFLTLFVFLWHFFINQIVCTQDTSNFPLSISGDAIIDFQKNETGFAVLTGKQLDLYSLSGIKLRTINNKAAHPVINCCEDLILLYEQGGTSYSLEKSDSTVTQNVTDGRIILAKVAKNGNVALIIEDEKYVCSLVVYNKSSNQIFKWNLAESVITDFCFTNGGDGCFVATMGAKNGVSKSTIYGLNFSNKKELFKTNIGDNMPIAIGFNKGNIQIICENKLIFLDNNGSILKEKPYIDELEKYIFTPNNYIVMLFSEKYKLTSNLIVYDGFGEQVSQIEIKEKIKKIYSDGEHVIVLTRSSIICYDMHLNILNTLNNKQDVSKLICINSFIYNISMNRIHKIAIN